MKKLRTAVLIVLFLAILVPVFAQYDDSRLEAMGSIGIAVSDNRHPNVINPATLYFYEDSQVFVINGQYQDSFLLDSKESFPAYPSSGFNGSFIGKMISFSIGFDFNVDSGNENDDIKYYNIYQNTEIKLNLSAGLGNFSAGIGIYGGSSKQRSNVSIHHTSAAYDFFVQTFLGTYDRVLDSEYLQMNVGFMFKTGDLSIGILCDNILDIDDSKTTFSWDSFIKEAGIGLYYTSGEYGRRGRLNTFGYSFGLEISNLFTSTSRDLSAGFELSLLLAKDYSLYFRTGYHALFESFGYGTHSVGFGAKLDKFELNANAHFPVSVYRGLDNGDRLSMAVSFTVTI